MLLPSVFIKTGTSIVDPSRIVAVLGERKSIDFGISVDAST
jgi:hypothetical protein